MYTQDNTNTLREVLEQLPSPSDEVIPLPIAHLTTIESFQTIVGNGGKLIPSKCKVFNCKLLYFSYGGVFHRHKQEQTNDELLFPIALLFSPKLLFKINCFFPYDTGGAKGEFYDSWSDELSNFEKYRIPNNDERYTLPSKLVYHTYGSNREYLKGKALPSQEQQARQQEPLITLLNFLRDDLTKCNADHRRRSIECQTSTSINLQEVFDDILWIGLPKDLECIKQFDKLCRLVNPIRRPPYDLYDVYESENCYALARMLQGKAREAIINPRYLVDFGSSDNGEA